MLRLYLGLCSGQRVHLRYRRFREDGGLGDCIEREEITGHVRSGDVMYPVREIWEFGCPNCLNVVESTCSA